MTPISLATETQRRLHEARKQRQAKFYPVPVKPQRQAPVETVASSDLQPEPLQTESRPLPRPTSRTVGAIQRLVARHFDVTMKEMLSRRRYKHVVFVRHVAFYLARIHTKRSLPEIGRMFGGMDHTSVLNGIRKIERRRQTDKELDDQLNDLSAQLTDTFKPLGEITAGIVEKLDVKS